jgi:hypothetical protein
MPQTALQDKQGVEGEGGDREQGMGEGCNIMSTEA